MGEYARNKMGKAKLIRKKGEVNYFQHPKADIKYKP